MRSPIRSLILYIHALIFFIELHKHIIFFIQKHIYNHFSISVISYSYTSIHSFLYFHLLCFYDFYNVKLTYLSVIIEYMQIQGRRRRGGSGGLCPPTFKSGGAQVGLSPPTFGQIKCSNFAISSFFKVKNAKFSWLASLANLL